MSFPLLGTSLSIPVKKREPLLGEWQRIVLVELDGSRNREIAITFITENQPRTPECLVRSANTIRTGSETGSNLSDGELSTCAYSWHHPCSTTYLKTKGGNYD